MVGPMNDLDLNAYWKSIVDTIQDGVMVVSPQGIIISVNRAFEEITGYPHGEIVGRACTTLNCTSCEIAREKPGCHWCVMFEKGQLKKQRCTIARKDGRSVQILKNASVLKDWRDRLWCRGDHYRHHRPGRKGDPDRKFPAGTGRRRPLSWHDRCQPADAAGV